MMTKLVFILTLMSAAANAQETTAPLAVEGTTATQEAAPPLEKRYKRILVTDEVEDFVANPASPQKVSKEKIEMYKYTDVNRALRQTAGAYVREEDGQGLRPNIGLRGTNPDRSKKVVILEDGILAGPAPYSAPAAYYTPAMNHTQSLEIYKGFTAVPYGPNSIGGSVNYLSLDIPNDFTPKLEASTGAFNTQNYRASIGDNSGAVGYIVQVSRLSSDGFKKLDGGGDTGFEQNEITANSKATSPAIRIWKCEWASRPRIPMKPTSDCRPTIWRATRTAATPRPKPTTWNGIITRPNSSTACRSATRPS
jgi:Fe(3+) dicitrate transport protein